MFYPLKHLRVPNNPKQTYQQVHHSNFYQHHNNKKGNQNIVV